MALWGLFSIAQAQQSRRSETLEIMKQKSSINRCLTSCLVPPHIKTKLPLLYIISILSGESSVIFSVLSLPLLPLDNLWQQLLVSMIPSGKMLFKQIHSGSNCSIIFRNSVNWNHQFNFLRVNAWQSIFLQFYWHCKTAIKAVIADLTLA